MKIFFTTLFSLIYFTNQDRENIFNEYQTYFPYSLTLLNQNILLVINDGIHFFDSNLENEDITKKINFNSKIEQENDFQKTSIAQFSSEDGGYIMVLALNKIYFFSSEGNFINNIDLSYYINANYYSLVPYKKENNFLHYIISHSNPEYNFTINYFKFDINSPNDNSLELTKKYNVSIQYSTSNYPTAISGPSCLFLSPSDYDHDILNCFYSVFFPFELHSRAFDPNNNFEEIYAYFNYLYEEFNSHEAKYLYAITNNEKKKAFIMMIRNSCPYSAIYDFNSFSIPKKEILRESCDLEGNYHKNRFIYFRETNEFIFVSSRWSVPPIPMIIFNSDFSVQKIGKFQTASNVWGIYTSCPFYNGEDYYMIYDNKNFINIGKIENLIPEEINVVEVPESTSIFEVPESTSIFEVPESTSIFEVPESTITFEVPESTITFEVPESTITFEVPESTNIFEVPESTITFEVPESTITFEVQTENKLESTIITTPTFTKNIKCKEATYESANYDLCTECNYENGYYEVQYYDNSFLHGYIECFKMDNKPDNLFFDNTHRIFKQCYQTCKKCFRAGNENVHNCLECENNYIKQPDISDTTNCVISCRYKYYYTSYGQYKCTVDDKCPEEAQIYIDELKKCTNDCKNEEIYKYKYGGKCLKNCPENTESNENNICIDINLNSCTKTEKEIGFKEELDLNEIDLNAKNYAEEFSYTDKHINYYYNNLYSILLYKDYYCIDELSLNMPKVDFGNCFLKVLENLNPPTKDNIIIALV